MLRCLALLGLLVSATRSEAGSDETPEAIARPEASSTPSTAFFFPAPGAFERLLNRLERVTDSAHGQSAPGARPLRIVQIGDSHTEGGFFSRELAEQLAPGKPTSPGLLWPDMFAPSDFSVVRLGRRKDWREVSWLDSRATGPFGPRGVAFVTTRPGAVMEFRAVAEPPAGTRLTVFYGVHPGQRPAELLDANGKLLARITVPREMPESSLGRIDLPWPEHATTVQLRTAGGAGSAEFRLFGIAVDRPDAALSFAVLGARGTTSDHPLRRDDGALVEFLRQRPPDVLVVWFGTNSAVVQPFQPEPFGESFTGLLDKLRGAAPEASLLVIGPPDLARRPNGCPAWAFHKRRPLYPSEREALKRFACAPETTVTRDRAGQPRYPAKNIRTEAQWRDWLATCSFATLPTIEQVAELERTATVAAGGMFFDAYAFMGGPGSMHSWVCEEPRLAEFDHVHLTPQGHARLAAGLRDALRVRTGSR